MEPIQYFGKILLIELFGPIIHNRSISGTRIDQIKYFKQPKPIFRIKKQLIPQNGNKKEFHFLFTLNKLT